ncbi:MAG: hypothetical protein PHO79_05400, partial [Desulfoplanes sp.]|nr:hypothetical protein [Desulfoplanes sp.]
TFQTLGLLVAETGTLTLLEPVRKLSYEKWALTAPFSLLEAETKNDPADCIALYQSASMRHQLGLDRNRPGERTPYLAKATDFPLKQKWDQ